MPFRITLAFFALCCAAETHKVAAKRYYNSFHHRHAVLQSIKSGDVVLTKTADASGRDENGIHVALSAQVAVRARRRARPPER